MTMNAVAKKTKADKAQNKAALQKRLAERRCVSCPFARVRPAFSGASKG